MTNHKTLQKVFEEKVFDLIIPDREIHPQYLADSGLALSVKEYEFKEVEIIYINKGKEKKSKAKSA